MRRKRKRGEEIGEGAEEREGEGDIYIHVCEVERGRNVRSRHTTVWTRAHMTNLLGHVIHIVPGVL